MQSVQQSTIQQRSFHFDLSGNCLYIFDLSLVSPTHHCPCFDFMCFAWYRFSMKTSYQTRVLAFHFFFFFFSQIQLGSARLWQSKRSVFFFWLRFNLFTHLECSAFHGGYLQITINHSGYQIARLSIHFR